MEDGKKVVKEKRVCRTKRENGGNHLIELPSTRNTIRARKQFAGQERLLLFLSCRKETLHGLFGLPAFAAQLQGQIKRPSQPPSPMSVCLIPCFFSLSLSY